MTKVVDVGLSFTFPQYRGGEQVEIPFTVAAKCSNQGGGQWICTTHKQAFRHNADRDSHTSGKKSCVLAWYCFEHGPEVP